MSKKTNDNWVVPLCSKHHTLLHTQGERSFWKKHKLEPKIYAALLWRLNGYSEPPSRN